MKHLFSFFYLFLALITNSVMSAQEYKISGRIVSQSSQPIEFLEVSLLSSDSIEIVSTLTDEKGMFQIIGEKGKYLLKGEQLGETFFLNEIDVNSDLDLGEIKVEKTVALQEVIISGNRKLIERKVDRLVFNVENSTSAIGGDATEVLSVTPGISLRNNQLSMIGKSNLSLMVNDRIIQLSGEDLMNYLKTISVDDIKNIEVITNPPAKYEAEGNSGIVNINLKGIRADYWNASFRSIYEQAKYAKGTVIGAFNYQKKKLSISSIVNYQYGTDLSFTEQQISYNNESLFSFTDQKDHTKLIGAKFNLDYSLTKKLSFGLQYIGSNNRPDISQFNHTDVYDNFLNTLSNYSQTNLNNKREFNNHSLNFHTIYSIDSIGRKLSFDLDYLNLKKNNDQLFNSEETTGGLTEIQSVNTIGDQNIENTSFKLDMTHPVKGFDIDYGTKFSFTKTYNSIDYYNLTENISVFDYNDKFDYKENIQSLYISVLKKLISNKLIVKLGLRLENTQAKGNSIIQEQSFNNNYINLFPTGYLLYSLSDINQLSFSYGKRINRPKYSMVNPFREYMSFFSYVEGNPSLKPSITHNFELNYTYKYNLNTTFYYSIENDGYFPITYLDENSINQYTKPENAFMTQTFGINSSYSFSKLKWLTSTFFINYHYSFSESKISVVQNTTEGSGANIYNNNSVFFNKEKSISAGVSFNYFFPSIKYNASYESVFSTNVNAKLLLLKKNLQIGLNITDLFNSNKQRWSSYSNSVLVKNSYLNNAPKFTISLSYKFGNRNIDANDRDVSNEDEKGRSK